MEFFKPRQFYLLRTKLKTNEIEIRCHLEKRRDSFIDEDTQKKFETLVITEDNYFEYELMILRFARMIFIFRNKLIIISL